MSIASARRLAAGLIVASSFAFGATQPAAASAAAPAPAPAAVAKTGDRAGGSLEVKGRKNTRADLKQRKDSSTIFRAHGRKNH
jgi:hypothetical protein